MNENEKERAAPVIAREGPSPKRVEGVVSGGGGILVSRSTTTIALTENCLIAVIQLSSFCVCLLPF